MLYDGSSACVSEWDLLSGGQRSPPSLQAQIAIVDNTVQITADGEVMLWTQPIWRATLS